jgi:hypothetical protein
LGLLWLGVILGGVFGPGLVLLLGDGVLLEIFVCKVHTGVGGIGSIGFGEKLKRSGW